MDIFKLEALNYTYMKLQTLSQNSLNSINDPTFPHMSLHTSIYIHNKSFDWCGTFMKSLILYKQLEEVSFSLTIYDEKGKSDDIFSGLNEKEEVNISIVATSLNIDSSIRWSYEHGKSKHCLLEFNKKLRNRWIIANDLPYRKNTSIQWNLYQ